VAHGSNGFAIFMVIMLLVMILLYSGQAIYLSYNMDGAFGKWLNCVTWVMLWFKCVDILDALVD
jgi:hypothetical protein